MNSKMITIFYAFLLFLMFAPHAHAYLDPGTGSYVLQVVAAVFLAGTVVIKGFWKNIRDIFDKLFSRKGKDSETHSSKKS